MIPLIPEYIYIQRETELRDALTHEIKQYRVRYITSTTDFRKAVRTGNFVLRWLNCHGSSKAIQYYIQHFDRYRITRDFWPGIKNCTINIHFEPGNSIIFRSNYSILYKVDYSFKAEDYFEKY